MPEVEVLKKYTQKESNLKTDEIFVINRLKLFSFDIGSECVVG